MSEFVFLPSNTILGEIEKHERKKIALCSAARAGCVELNGRPLQVRHQAVQFIPTLTCRGERKWRARGKYESWMDVKKCVVGGVSSLCLLSKENRANSFKTSETAVVSEGDSN